MLNPFNFQRQPTDSLLNPWRALQRFGNPQSTMIASHQFSQTAIAGTVLKVLNWNIAKQNYQGHWQTEFAAILHQCQPDLIFFQEVRVEATANCPIHVQDMGWHFTPNFMDHHTRHHFGLLTASKVRHSSWQSVLTRHAEPIVSTPKAALFTEYPIQGRSQSLLTANVHGINFVSNRKFAAQLRQLEAELLHHRGPMLLCGDLNTWNPHRITLMQQMMERLHLKSVQFCLEGHRNLKRFLGSSPLDHIFYRGLSAQPGSAGVLAQCLSSDHKPMVVEFSL
jgi:endonuclease/exonuclease/phosphatase (EEP) superfamily protein YafD